MHTENYNTILACATAELVEKRSRFLAEVRPLTTEGEAAAFVAEHKSRYHDARHSCSAWVLRNGVLRYSDDGEPQGTAGMPMLEVLRREGLTDIAAVVTRYFGGILLGTGGLVRAYSGSLKLALDAAVRVRMCRCALLLLELPYTEYGKVEKLLEQQKVEVLDTSFTADITLSLRLEMGKVSAFEDQLRELSSGKLAAVPVGEEFAPVRLEP